MRYSNVMEVCSTTLGKSAPEGLSQDYVEIRIAWTRDLALKTFSLLSRQIILNQTDL